MGLFNRTLRVARANLNHWLAAAEDPEVVLVQAMGTLQQELMALRQAAARAIAAQKQTERQATQAESIAANWQQRARVALSQGREAEARKALMHRRTVVRSAIALRAQVEEQQVCTTKLQEQLRDLEQQLRAAKTQQELLLARARSAEAANTAYKLQEEVTLGTLGALERLEDQVMAVEAQAEWAALQARQSSQHS